MSKQLSRRIGGKRAKKLGDMFENLIERSCAYYRAKKIAHIRKTPEPFRMVSKGRNGQVIGFYEKQAQPDFQGTLENGQSIVFEAKHTNSTNLPFSRISREQSSELDRHSEIEAECFVIASFKFEQFYLIPWQDWKHLERTIGKKSVNRKDLAKYEIKLANGRLAFLEGFIHE